jgi:hypothetical protein
MYVMLSGMFAMYEHPLFIPLPTYSLLAIVLKPCDTTYRSLAIVLTPCDTFYFLWRIFSLFYFLPRIFW